MHTKYQWESHKMTIVYTTLSFSDEGNPDTLVCGNCREYFSELSDLLEHKRSYCKLRFACKCQENVQSEFEKTLK